MTNKKRHWKPATQLVHSGTLRSQHGETSEAIYLTQGYVYETAEAAEARFKGEEPGFIYSRYANPTVAMFEERMRLLEGAGASREDAAAVGHGGVEEEREELVRDVVVVADRAGVALA